MLSPHGTINGQFIYRLTVIRKTYTLIQLIGSIILWFSVKLFWMEKKIESLEPFPSLSSRLCLIAPVYHSLFNLTVQRGFYFHPFLVFIKPLCWLRCLHSLIYWVLFLGFSNPSETNTCALWKKMRTVSVCNRYFILTYV